MEYRRNSNGLQTCLEHSGLLVPLAASAFSFYLTKLHGASWLTVWVFSIGLQIVGAVMIGYAKLPAYRSGRFFTFGIKSIPAHRAAHYRWGWRVFSIGVTLSLAVLLGSP